MRPGQEEVACTSAGGGGGGAGAISAGGGGGGQGSSTQEDGGAAVSSAGDVVAPGRNVMQAYQNASAFGMQNAAASFYSQGQYSMLQQTYPMTDGEYRFTRTLKF